MEENRAAAAGDAWRGVVIDLDNEIVKVVVPPEPIAVAIAAKFHRPVVMAAGGIFTPAVLGPNGANRQEGLRPLVPIGPPPQSNWSETAFWGSPIALALVSDDPTAPKCDRDRMGPEREPTPAGIASRRPDADRCQGPITCFCSVSN